MNKHCIIALLCALATLLPKSALATEASYTINFLAGTNTNAMTASTEINAIVDQASVQYLANVVSTTRCYNNSGSGSNPVGLKFGSNSGVGSVKFNVAEAGQVVPTKIDFEIVGWSTSEGSFKFTANALAGTFENKSTTAKTVTLVCTSMTDKLTTLTLETTSKRGFVKSIKVYYEDNGGGNDGPVAPTTLTITPESGTYKVASQQVTIAVDEQASECQIRYTTDGTQATKDSTPYAGPFFVTESCTVNAIAWNDANADNPVTATATYVIEVPETLTATVNLKTQSYSGNYPTGGKEVNWLSEDKTLTFVTSATITGSTYPLLNTNGLRIYNSNGNTVTVKAPEGMIFLSAKATLGTTANKVSFQGPNETSATTVGNNEAYIFANGSATNNTFELRSVKTNNNNNSDITALTFELAYEKEPTQVGDIQASLDNEAEVLVGTKVVYSTLTQGAKLYGTILNPKAEETTLDGAEMPYTLTLDKDGTWMVELTAKKDGLDDSETLNASYTVTLPQVAKPEFNIADGEKFNAGTTVTITCATEGARLNAVIKNEENKEEDLEGAFPFNYTITVPGTYIIEAYAYKDGMKDSEVVSVAYEVTEPTVATPVASVTTGATLEAGDKVTFTSATEGAEIYLIVGVGEDMDEVCGASPYTLTLNTTGVYDILAAAKKEGMKESETLEVEYTVVARTVGTPAFGTPADKPVKAGTKVTVSADKADAITLTTWDITGHATQQRIDGDNIEVTVDKLHRRFAAKAHRAGVDDTGETEIFYNIAALTGGAYNIVTSAADLSDGDEIVLVADCVINNVGVKGVMAISQDSNHRRFDITAAEIENGVVTKLTTNTKDPLVFILEDAGDGKFYFRTKEPGYVQGSYTEAIGYLNDYGNLNVTGSTQNYLSTSAAKLQAATVTINDDNTFSIIFDQYTSGDKTLGTLNPIRLNSQNKQFSVYALQTYPMPYIYKYSADGGSGEDYALGLHHSAWNSAAGSRRAVAAADHDTHADFVAGATADDGTVTYTATTQNLCGAFALTVDGTELAGHADEAKTDFSALCNDGCNLGQDDHTPYVHVAENTAVTLVDAAHEKAVPLSTNPDDHHGELLLYDAPKMTVAMKPFYSASMTLDKGTGTVTGVEDIAADAADSTETLYNLQGVAIPAGAKPAPGLYISRRGNTATRVIVR